MFGIGWPKARAHANAVYRNGRPEFAICLSNETMGQRWWPCLGHNTTLGWISIKLLDLARQVLVSCVSEGVIVFYLLCLIYAQRKLISTLLGYGIIMLKKIREEDVSLWSINKFRCTIFKFRHTNKYLPFVEVQKTIIIMI